MKQDTEYKTLVFATAFFTLMFELIVSKVANFHIDFRSSLLALPIAFLGLAVGSLHVHFSPRLRERFNIRHNLNLLAVVVSATLLLLFAIFTQLFEITGVGGYHLYLPYLLGKSLLFVALLTLPFYVFGRIFTLCFHVKRDEIGSLYGIDFLAAALACFLTPFLFHWVNLPAVIVALLVAISLALVLFSPHRGARRLMLAGGLAAAIAVFYWAIVRMDSSMTYLYWTTEDNAPETVEIASRWNEFSRVQLVEFRYKNTPFRNHYKIIHDNARSNVHVYPYDPAVQAEPTQLDALEAPFLMGHEPREALVMFAGCGAEMTQINQYAKGAANITGIEINRACADLATVPALGGYRLQEFYDLPNIDLRFQEGRSFLELTQKKFDMIFVGSSAPLALAFTGDTRKYLYTKEALTRYLAILSDDGMLLFDHQPINRTIDTLKQIFIERGRDDFANCIVILDAGSKDLLFKPSGFTPVEMLKLRGVPGAQNRLLYAPHQNNLPKNARWAKMVKGGVDGWIPVDDHPFLVGLDFEHYTPVPSEQQLKDDGYFISWIRITTVLFLAVLAGLFILIAQFGGRKDRRLPPSIMLYLLATGFIYMLIQVVYIARLELFLQNALISMASVIAIFLFTNGLGSYMYARVAKPMGMVVFPIFVACVLGGSIYALYFWVPQLMDLSLFMRLVVCALVIAPVGWTLGMFYPYAVAMLIKHERAEAVPITYGISTLSSVLGATYAMTMMIEWGFSTLLFQAVAGYAIVAGGVLCYGSVAKRNLLS